MGPDPAVTRPRVFLSYRRSDAAAAAFTIPLYTRFTRAFGKGHVFMDVDDIPAGTDFREHIRDILGMSDALIAVIGAGWDGGPGRSTQTRLHDPDDWVRAEVALAMERGIKVIPLLVQGTTMPSEGDLPVDLRPLAYLNAVEISNKDFSAKSRRLVRDIQAAAGAIRAPEEQPADSVPNNLPAEMTRFVGRKQELEALRALISSQDVKLVTISGTGGTGKSRLALRLAAEIMARFRGGVFHVALASVAHPDLVAPAIAGALGLTEEQEKPLEQVITKHLRSKSCLLVLDNFEHVLDAAEVVGSILRSCRKVKIVVTSRVVLRLYGEHDFVLGPLPLPQSQEMSLEALLATPSVQLFVDRGAAADPSFRLTEENRDQVAAICARLEGLPLAIELAAARIRVLPLELLRTRLANRLDTLTGGPRDVPGHQQTLRGTLNWSYDLLGKQEQAFFRRLGVFVGGWTQEAAEAIWNGPGRNGLEMTDVLLDASLIERRSDGPGQPRLGLLETVREYALERLEERGEAATARQSHAQFFLETVGTASKALESEEQLSWMRLMEDEEANLREAVEWWLTAGDGAKAAEMVLGLAPFWEQRVLLAEGRSWIERALEQVTGDGALRSRLLQQAAWFAFYQGDLGDARGLLEAGLDVARRVGDDALIAKAFKGLGGLAREEGRPEEAKRLYRQGLSAEESLGDSSGMAKSLNNLGVLATDAGDAAEAAGLFARGLTLARQAGDRRLIATLLGNLGELAASESQTTDAESLYAQAFALFLELRDWWNVAGVLELLATMYARGGAGLLGAHLKGAAETVCLRHEIPRGGFDDQRMDEALNAARSEAGEKAWRKALEEGRRMTPEEAIRLVTERGEAQGKTPETRGSS